MFSKVMEEIQVDFDGSKEQVEQYKTGEEISDNIYLTYTWTLRIELTIY